MVMTNDQPVDATPMGKSVEEYLAELDGLIDPTHQAAVEQRQLKSFRYEPIDHIPVMLTLRDDVSHQTFGSSGWPTFAWPEQMKDWDNMLLNELSPAYESALLKDDKCFSIRPNLGIGTIPTLFGCSIDCPDPVLDSMPWVVRTEGHTKEFIQELIDKGVPDPSGGVLETYAKIVANWRDRIEPYPNLKRFCHITLPDNQGPFNLAFHLRGTELYTDILDDPQFVHNLLNLMTETYIAVSRWSKTINREPIDEGYYWNWHLNGGVRNVDDNSVLLGPDQYAEFVKPYNSRALSAFNGGAHHFCGEGFQIFPHVCEIESINAVHFGNPEMQHFEEVHPELAKRKICILWDHPLDGEHRAAATTGIVVRETVRTLDAAKARLEDYRKSW